MSKTSPHRLLLIAGTGLVVAQGIGNIMFADNEEQRRFWLFVMCGSVALAAVGYSRL